MDVESIGCTLSVVYGLGLLFYLVVFISSFLNPQSVLQSTFFMSRFSNIHDFQGHMILFWVLYFPQFIGFMAVVKLKDWGRQLVVAMNASLCLYSFYEIISLWPAFDCLIAASMLFYIVIALFFELPRIREQFARVSNSLGKKILLIDDDAGIIKMVKSNLMKEGFSVLTATTGERGLQIAKSNKPDLILLDVILPTKVKGREVCVRLKRDSETRDIPVVFLTAKDSPDDIKAEMEIGAVSHLTKPVNFFKLLSEVKRILGL